MKNIILNKIVFFCMLLAVPFSAMADDIDGGNGEVQDISAASIDDDIAFAISGEFSIA